MNHDITQAKFYYGLCKNIYWIILWAKKMSHPAERAQTETDEAPRSETGRFLSLIVSLLNYIII